MNCDPARSADRWVLLAALIAPLTLVGCGPSQEVTNILESDQATGLHNLSELYRFFQQSNNRPPNSFEELRAIEAGMPGGLAGIGEENSVVFWGTELTDLGEMPGTTRSEEVLAYETQVPESGGFVLLRDRRVVKMSPEEFAAAPKAGNDPAE
ncbi:hypothetical protein AB1L88_03275 [Tautonia sp. JC769]|uniref:hypothetical protein n=1 Tax=Tautonia sp. JC769 TaxID=3232135 RepID=UPI00345B4040